MKRVIQSKHKIDVVQSELLDSPHSISAISSMKNSELLSEQYLNVFNRYQVLHAMTIIIVVIAYKITFIQNLFRAIQKKILLNVLKIQNRYY